jgi:hypothetical protein
MFPDDPGQNFPPFQTDLQFTILVLQKDDFLHPQLSGRSKLFLLPYIGQPIPGHGRILGSLVSPGQNHIGDFFACLHP